MELKVSVTIRREKEFFVVYCAEYNLTAYGLKLEDALTDLQRKVYEYLAEDQLSVSTSVTFIIKMPLSV